ncbi:hypothetical protein NDU88_000239 [Pleurodeles waltl]|uniref:Secreted protein n=1 Tax=Pleurodeles waltl TaxID=8319 RepID=A0AAV7TED7_PLEWA|nr:hypothetical protein NDU88_000239 [Pleurodeles waltl]
MWCRLAALGPGCAVIVVTRDLRALIYAPSGLFRITAVFWGPPQGCGVAWPHLAWPRCYTCNTRSPRVNFCPSADSAQCTKRKLPKGPASPSARCPYSQLAL